MPDIMTVETADRMLMPAGNDGKVWTMNIAEKILPNLTSTIYSIKSTLFYLFLFLIDHAFILLNFYSPCTCFITLKWFVRQSKVHIFLNCRVKQWVFVQRHILIFFQIWKYYYWVWITLLFFYFFINIGVRVSLCTSQLITQTLKLTSMQKIYTDTSFIWIYKGCLKLHF